MKQIPDISFVILNFEGLKDTEKLLGSIHSLKSRNFSYETIVVDNGSRNDSFERFPARYPDVNLIKNQHNLGFSGGNNVGIKASRGRYVMLLNNDTWFTDSSVFEMVRFMDENTSIGAASPKILFGHYPGIIQYAGFTDLSPITLRNKAIGYCEKDCGQFDTPSETGFIHGAAVMIRREVFDKAGLLPEIFFLYYEELDWSYSVKRAGYELWYLPLASIVHNETRNNNKFSYNKRYYMTRNRLLLAYRNRRGVQRVLSLLYLVLVAYMKDLILLLLNGEFRQADAVIKGIFAFNMMEK